MLEELREFLLEYIEQNSENYYHVKPSHILVLNGYRVFGILLQHNCIWFNVFNTKKGQGITQVEVREQDTRELKIGVYSLKREITFNPKQVKDTKQCLR